MSRLGMLVAAVLCAAAIGSAWAVDLPDVAATLRSFAAGLGPWTYAIVAVLVALETAAAIGLVSPGESALAVGGAAAAHGAVELGLLIAVAWVAGVAGDCVGFGLGRRHGRAWLLRSGSHIGVSADRLERLEDVVRRWGGAALIVGRFVGLVRAFAPFLAGAAELPRRRVAVCSVIGAGAWSAAFIVAGYAFAASLENHLDVVGNLALAGLGALALVWALRRSRLGAGASCPPGAALASSRLSAPGGHAAPAQPSPVLS